MGLFTEIGKAWRDEGIESPFRHYADQIEAQRGVLADHLTIGWLASAICERTELSFEEAAQLVVGVAAGGGPDGHGAERSADAAYQAGSRERHPQAVRD